MTQDFAVVAARRSLRYPWMIRGRVMKSAFVFLYSLALLGGHLRNGDVLDRFTIAVVQLEPVPIPGSSRPPNAAGAERIEQDSATSRYLPHVFRSALNRSKNPAQSGKIILGNRLISVPLPCDRRSCVERRSGLLRKPGEICSVAYIKDYKSILSVPIIVIS